MATTRITGVHTVGIPVSDQDRALDFYVGTLGFEKRLDAVFGGGQRWIEVAPPGGTTTIALVTAGQGLRTGEDTRVRLSTTDAAADHAALRESGVAVDELLRWEGVPPMFRFRDPDGNAMVIVEQR